MGDESIVEMGIALPAELRHHEGPRRGSNPRQMEFQRHSPLIKEMSCEDKHGGTYFRALTAELRPPEPGGRRDSNPRPRALQAVVPPAFLAGHQKNGTASVPLKRAVTGRRDSMRPDTFWRCNLIGIRPVKAIRLCGLSLFLSSAIRQCPTARRRSHSPSGSRPSHRPQRPPTA